MNHFYNGGDDLYGLGAPTFSNHGQDPFSLGQEVLMSDSGALSPISLSTATGTSSTGTVSSGATPSPTLVSAAGSNLEIDLVWDSSVAGAPSGFTSAVATAADSLVTDFTTAAKTVLHVDVGWGEVGGQSMAANALGESESAGYLTSYATVANDLARHGESLNASNEPTSGQFFVDSAEAKAFGMISGTSSAVDGYVGFSTLAGTGDSWQFAATGTASNQFNFESVVQHELTEVMGRTAMEGTTVYNGAKTYTPLDLFDYSASHTLALSNTGGYFSNNGGATRMGTFNDAAAYGGDIGDWASYASASQSGTLASGSDSFDAFTRPGYNDALSADDLLEMNAIGYGLTSAGAALA